MGKLKYLIIHCTDTPEGRKVTSKELRKWHMSPKPKGRGWDRVGYSDMIHLDGSIENLTPYDEDDIITQHEMTWGVTGINSNARHIVYVGGTDSKGKPKDTLNESQFMALQGYIKEFLYKHPDCLIGGHNQFANKACPSFDVPDKLSLMSIPDKNIYSPV